MAVPEEVRKSYKGGSEIKTGNKGVSYYSGIEDIIGKTVEEVENEPYIGKIDLIGGLVSGGATAAGYTAGVIKITQELLDEIPREYLMSREGRNLFTVGLTTYGVAAALIGIGFTLLGTGAGLEISERIGKKIGEPIYERKKTKIKESVEEVPKKLEKLKDHLQEQYASLPSTREDIRIPYAEVREIEKELVEGYNAYINGKSNKVPILEEKRGGKPKIVYKKL